MWPIIFNTLTCLILPMTLFWLSQKFVDYCHQKWGLDTIDENNNADPSTTIVMVDQSIIMTKSINQYLNRHRSLLNMITTVTSLILDTIILCIMWEAVVGEFKYLLVLITSISIRQVSQLMVQIKSCPSLLWIDPGFPSLFVNYNIRTDYYFSGHTVCATVGYLFLSDCGFGYLGMIILAIEVIFISVTHAHYYPDILTGFLTPFALLSMFERVGLI